MAVSDYLGSTDGGCHYVKLKVSVFDFTAIFFVANAGDISFRALLAPSLTKLGIGIRYSVFGQGHN